MKWLTEEDWYVLSFYRRVGDLYINQTPMGVEKGQPVLTPDLSAWKDVLEIYDYPKFLWTWLLDSSLMLHRLVRGLDEVYWPYEMGKPQEHVLPEEVY